MKRRGFLAVLSATVSGCLSGIPEDTETDAESEAESGSEEVSLSSEDTTATNPDVSLVLEYSGEVLYELRTEEGRQSPKEGMKFLMVRTRITNVGDSARDLTAQQYLLTSGDKEYEPAFIGTEGYVSEIIIPPGTRTNAWVLFEIPQETSQATLTARQDRIEPRFSVEFVPNPGIEGIMR